MKYELGMRWVWRDDNLAQVLPDGHDILRGYICEIKPGNNIIIKWENGRMIQYTDFMIKDDTRLSLDKEWYRNEKLEILGI